jgi:hypothetical protein
MERRIRPVVAKRAAGHARRGAHHHAVGAANLLDRGPDFPRLNRQHRDRSLTRLEARYEIRAAAGFAIAEPVDAMSQEGKDRSRAALSALVPPRLHPLG